MAAHSVTSSRFLYPSPVACWRHISLSLPRADSWFAFGSPWFRREDSRERQNMVRSSKQPLCMRCATACHCARCVYARCCIHTWRSTTWLAPTAATFENLRFGGTRCPSCSAVLWWKERAEKGDWREEAYVHFLAWKKAGFGWRERGGWAGRLSLTAWLVRQHSVWPAFFYLFCSVPSCTFSAVALCLSPSCLFHLFHVFCVREPEPFLLCLLAAIPAAATRLNGTGCRA